jgi:hypothetical protein
MAMASQQMKVYTADGSQSSELVPITVPCTLAVDSRTSMVEVVGILPAMTMNSWHGRDTKNGIDSKGGSSNNAVVTHGKVGMMGSLMTITISILGHLM